MPIRSPSAPNLLCVAILAAFLLAGCAAVGPSTVPRDRFDYNTAVSDSWKEQTLLNIVKLRYADMPLFIEVASIVSGYSLERSVNVSGTAIDGGAVGGSGTLGGSGKYTERPTITYAPITGGDFNKTFMTPVPPSSVLFLLQSGWPADMVLPLTMEAINGLHAQHSGGSHRFAGNASYYRAIELFTVLQLAGALGMRVISNDEEKDATVIVIRKKDVPAEIVSAAEELAALLGIRADADQYTVTYAETAKNDTEFAMVTRSTLSIMLELAGQVAVPAEHVEEGRTYPSLVVTPRAEDDGRRLINIRSSKERQDDAFVSVRYRDYWFWVDDRDLKSKRTFAYLMLLFSLTESGGKEGLPLVTIPSG